jgi:hypothetical protein
VETRSFKLLTREQIIARLEAMTGPKYLNRPTQITRGDMARWLGMPLQNIRLHMVGKVRISDSFQLIYSQFFQGVDRGELKLEYDARTRKKTIVRVDPNAKAPKPPIKGAIDFNTLRIKLE